MILELKKVFLSENESLSAETTVDLTDFERSGVQMFHEPLVVKLTASNHAGVVLLDIESTAL